MLNSIILHIVLNTSTGHLCDRQAQINAFKMTVEYKELLSSTIKHADFRMERIEQLWKYTSAVSCCRTGRKRMSHYCTTYMERLCMT